MKMKKNDIILIVIILVVAAVAFAMAVYLHTPGEKVVVTVDKKEYGVYDLNKNQTIQIDTAYGKNTLTIQDGKADMTDADCPDQICVKEAPLDDDTPSTIVCLPHKIIVQIQQKN